MNREQALRIQKNYLRLISELHAEEIADNLFTKRVIEHDDLQRVYAGETDRDKTKRLVHILLCREGSYQPFLDEIKSTRPDLVRHLTEIDVEEDLKKDKDERMQCLGLVVKRKYRAAKGEYLSETHILKDISFEYWDTGYGCVPKETESDLMECLQQVFPEVHRKEVSTKNDSVRMYMYYNIKRRFLGTSVEEEGVENTVKDLDDSSRSRKKSCTTILFQDIKSPCHLKHVLAPYFEKEGIDEKYLLVLEREKMDGKKLADCDMANLNILFADMPFGDKMGVRKIVDSILKEEKIKGPFLTFVLDTTQQKEETASKTINQLKFADINRIKEEYAYIKDAVFEVNVDFESMRRFLHRDDYDEYSLPKWIATETAKFAGACFTDLEYGTVVFGISVDIQKKGNIVGLHVNKATFMDIFYEEIIHCFYEDQLNIVLQSLRPPKFVKVHHMEHLNGKSESLFIVEIDISANSSFEDTLYIREKNEKQETLPKVYTFDINNVPKGFLSDDLKKYLSSNTKERSRRVSRYFDHDPLCDAKLYF